MADTLWTGTVLPIVVIVLEILAIVVPLLVAVAMATYFERKVLADMKLIEAMETLLDRVKKTKSNAEFLMSLGRSDWA